MKPETVDLGGPVHFVDFGGEGPKVVLVHGLGGSHANWIAVGRPLSARFRVFALDLAGFGRTPLAGRSASVQANTDLVARFLEEVAGGPAIVAGNSMGGLIAALLAASRPELVSRLILVNAALPRPPDAPFDRRLLALFTIYMTPLVGRLYLRRRAATVSPEQAVRELLELCGVDADKAPQEVFAAQVTMARDRLAMPWAHDAFITATRSIFATLGRRRQVEEALLKIRAPTLLIQGTRDRLVPLAAAEATARLRKDWTLAVLEGVGHVPQIQVPDQWLSVVLGWLDGGR